MQCRLPEDMLLQGRRVSQRSAAKRVKYDVELSDEDASGDKGDADDNDDSVGGLQKLKNQPRIPAAAKVNCLRGSQDDTASQQEAEPVRSGGGTAAAGRRQSMNTAGSGHLQTVPEEAEEEAAGEPDMTQKSIRKGAQKPQKAEVCSQPYAPQAGCIATAFTQ